jgi:hypothetical protein
VHTHEASRERRVGDQEAPWRVVPSLLAPLLGRQLVNQMSDWHDTVSDSSLWTLEHTCDQVRRSRLHRAHASWRVSDLPETRGSSHNPCGLQRQDVSTHGARTGDPQLPSR